MPRFKQLSEIVKLMSEKTRIRNLGIIAHIDHGKTTLTDSLLAGAGLLSPSMAGSARVLDFLEEEQKRKITIKTANISLLYRQHIINLVDTPGHVDFTGRVSRTLGAIDGAVVVVDAVEEIMAQTEVVTRQALEARVRPILFVNKVDKLIMELQLTAEQIEKKLQHVIDSFNDLIALYGEAPFKHEWRINPALDNVAFGSALHGWGFTLDIAKQEGVKFSDVVNAYRKNQQETLRKKLPAHKAIFEMAISKVPNPREAQGYRIEKIWGGHVQSVHGKVLTECRDDAPAIMYVTNVNVDSDGGLVATGRLFSGLIEKGEKFRILESQTETTVKHVYIQMGAFREEAAAISSGNIAALALTGRVRAGETLVESSHPQGMVPFEDIETFSEPVVTVAVEPKNPQNLPALREALDQLEIEDPDLRMEMKTDTGEILLHGMGELHLELALKKLRSNEPTVSSSPRVSYRETITKRGMDATGKSPNKQNRFVVRVEPLPKESGKPEVDDHGNALSMDEFRNVLVDISGKTEPLDEETLEAIIGGFEFACHSGPLCGEPLRHVKVSIIELQLAENAELRSSGK